MPAWNRIAGDGSQSPSSSVRSIPTLMTRSGSDSSKYSNGVTQNASSPSARALTWPATRLSQPLRARIRRDAAILNRTSSMSIVTPFGGTSTGGREVAEGRAGPRHFVDVDAVEPGRIRHRELRDRLRVEAADVGGVTFDRGARGGPDRGHVRIVARPHEVIGAGEPKVVQT